MQNNTNSTRANSPTHHPAPVPVLGFAALSGTGKTTLLAQLIPMLKAQGIRIGMIKHAHHEFDIDQPGKDSYRLRKAGASQMLIASTKRTALIHDYEHTPREPQLEELLAQLQQSCLDIVLVEGFKHECFDKIELHRPTLQHPVLYEHDSNIIAIATDTAHQPVRPIDILDINDIGAIARYIVDKYNLTAA